MAHIIAKTRTPTPKRLCERGRQRGLAAAHTSRECEHNRHHEPTERDSAEFLRIENPLQTIVVWAYRERACLFRGIKIAGACLSRIFSAAFVGLVTVNAVAIINPWQPLPVIPLAA